MKRMKSKIKYIITVLLCLGCTIGAMGQLPQVNHPELKWQTIETVHFFIHYHQGTLRTASVVAKIAEEIYAPLTELYDHEPDGKIHFVIRDHDDESNGTAFFYDNKVEIWAPSLDFQLRGSHNWLRGVVSHELSHMISMGAARKMPRQIPAVYFQWLDFEEEKRPDVLHGYPNTIISYPLAGTVIPLWFAEGLAQFSKQGMNYDRWDTHRDMVLRMAVLEGGFLSLEDMGVFGKNSLGNERVYNQGYGLALYLADQFGESSLKDLVHALRSPLRITFAGATKKVLGKSDGELYRTWKDWLLHEYKRGTESMKESLVTGDIVTQEGIGHFHPTFSRDGKRVAYLSNKGEDYLGRLSLWIYDLSIGKKRKIKGSVTSSASWSPDGNKIVYAKKTARTKQGSHFYDLYIYDLKSKKEKRITRLSRIRQPDWSPNGKQLVCVTESDGTSNLVLIDTDGKNLRPLTKYKHGEQLFSPRWMADGKTVVFSQNSKKHGRDIWSLEVETLQAEKIVHTTFDERDPYPSPDGKWIYYSSDRSGIFNIYRQSLNEHSEQELVSNVLGGGFMPTVNEKGELVYALFKANGYKLAYLKDVQSLRKNTAVYQSPYDNIRDKAEKDALPLAEYNDRIVESYTPKPYKPQYSKLMFLPRVMIDFPGRIKVGTYFYGSDILDRFTVLGGAAVNGLWDTDLFGIINYRRFYPTLFIEAFNQTRHIDREEIDAQFKLRYNLFEVDIGADWPLTDFDRLRTAYVYSQYKYAGSGHFPYQQVFGKFTSTYHRGHVLQIHWEHHGVSPTTESSISPSRGRRFSLELERAWQSYGDSAGVSEKHGTPIDIYSKHPYNQISLDWREYLPGLFKGQSMMMRLRAGLIDNDIPSFYHFYIGGLDGLKGYPFYSLEGRKLMQVELAYRFPLAKNLGLRFLWMQFQKVYLSVYGGAGDAWNEGAIDFKSWKKCVGAQLRVNLVSFYMYPMSLFVDGAYGLDTFSNRGVQYGKEWRFYFGILFDFLD